MLVLAALWCLVLGIGVTASIIEGGSLARTGTPMLLAAAGMLVLPGLTALALRLDARERRRSICPEPRQDAQPTLAHPAHADTTRRDPPAHRVRPADRAERLAGR